MNVTTFGGAGIGRLALLLLVLISLVTLLQQFELGRAVLSYALILLIVLTLVKNYQAIADVLNPPKNTAL